MFDVLLLTLISTLVGGIIFKESGMGGLATLLICNLLALVFYGGRIGLVVGVVGIGIITVLYFTSGGKETNW